MMTTGSVRGKCSRPAGGAGALPALRRPRRRARRSGRRSGGVACQPRMPFAAAAVPASATASSAITARRSPKSSASGRPGCVVAAVVEEGARAGGGALPSPGSRGRIAARRRRRPRKTGRVAGVGEDRRRPSAARRAAAAGPGSISGLPCQSARQSARGVGRERVASPRRCAARSSAPPGEGDGFGVSHALSPGRSVAARPCRKPAAAAIESGLKRGARAALSRRPRGWRGQALRQPGQVRKEAAVTVPAWVVVQPLTSSWTQRGRPDDHRRGGPQRPLAVSRPSPAGAGRSEFWLVGAGARRIGEPRCSASSTTCSAWGRDAR